MTELNPFSLYITATDIAGNNIIREFTIEFDTNIPDFNLKLNGKLLLNNSFHRTGELEISAETGFYTTITINGTGIETTIYFDTGFRSIYQIS